MDLSIIVAMTKSRVIGLDDKLPWHISDDLKNFKRLTTGNTIIMGSKTYESINKKPLPNRTNIVLSTRYNTNENLEHSNLILAKDMHEALEKADSFAKDVFFIGGAKVYEQCLPFVNKMYISHIKKDYPGNIYFPEYDTKMWHEIERKEYSEFDFVIYEKDKHIL